MSQKVSLVLCFFLCIILFGCKCLEYEINDSLINNETKNVQVVFLPCTIPANDISQANDSNIFGLCLITYFVAAAGAWNLIPNLFNWVEYITKYSKVYFPSSPTTNFTSPSYITFVNELQSSAPENHYDILVKYGLSKPLKLNPSNSTILPFFSEIIVGKYIDYVVCGFPLGAIIGSFILFIWKSIDPYKFIWCASILYIIGSLLITFSFNVLMILIGRIILGIAISFSSVAPSYLHQLSSLIKTLRSTEFPPNAIVSTTPEKFFNLFVFVITIPMFVYALFNCLFGALFFFSWRIINLVTTLLSIIALILSYYYPSPPLKKKPLTSIEKGDLFVVLFGKGLPALLIMISLHILQKLSLFNIILSYASNILPRLPYIGVILTAINLFSTPIYLIALKYIDISNLGVISGFGCGIASCFLAFGLQYNLLSFSILGTIGFLVFFAIGYGPLPWIITPKITDYAYSEVYIGIGSLFNWIGYLLVFLFVPSLKRHIGPSVFYISGMFCAVFGTIFIFVRPLNQAQEFFSFDRTKINKANDNI